MRITYQITLVSLILISLLGFSCNTSKSHTTTESHTLYITLQEGQSGKYIMKEYSKYTPSDIARSNKTLNQFTSTFNCSSSQFSTLKTSLTNDNNVIDIVDPQTTDNKIQSGKNEKHGKSKSIRDKN